jgi:hypothetical protein
MLKLQAERYGEGLTVLILVRVYVNAKPAVVENGI